MQLRISLGTFELDNLGSESSEVTPHLPNVYVCHNHERGGRRLRPPPRVEEDLSTRTVGGDCFSPKPAHLFTHGRPGFLSMYGPLHCPRHGSHHLTIVNA